MFVTRDRSAPPEPAATHRDAGAGSVGGDRVGGASGVGSRGVRADPEVGEASATATWLGEVASRLSHVDPSGWTRRELVEALAALTRLTSAAAACEARITNAVDHLGDHGADGAGVLRDVSGRSRRAARRRQRRARSLGAMPRVADAFGDGRLPEETVDALAAAAERTDPVRVDTDTELLRSVSGQPADRARRIVDDWIHAHQSAVDARRRLDRQRRDREAHWWTDQRDGMTHIHARLDPVTAAPLVASLDAEVDRWWRHDGVRDGTPDQVRSARRRRADALCRRLGVVSPHPDDPDLPTPETAGARIVVVVDLRTLAGRPDGTSHIVDTGPVPSDVLTAIARAYPATTTVQAALFDGPGRPLWLGRSRRLASADQRLLLAIRDRGCANCHAPTSHCHAHHDPPWERGGGTDIDRLTLLCARCHSEAHGRANPRRGP